MEPISSDAKEIIKSAVEVDRLNHKPEDDPAIKGLEEALCRIISGNRGDEDSNPISELLQTADLVKDPGDGSDLPDEDTEQGPSERLSSAMEEMDALIGLHDVKQQVRTMVNVLQVRRRCHQLNVRQ